MRQRLTEYVVKFDGVFERGCKTLREARDFCRDIGRFRKISELPNKVQIVKTTTVTEILNEYEPTLRVSLASVETFNDIEFEDMKG